MARVEAERDRARAVRDRNAAMIKQSRVSKEEYETGEFNLVAAEATVVREQARLAEADALLRQGRSSSATTRDDNAAAVGSGSPRTLDDWRDQVEWWELQLRGKISKLPFAQIKVDLADQNAKITATLADQGRVEKIRTVQAEADLQLARAELAAGQFEVNEAELRLKQAKNRLEQETAKVKREAERAWDRVVWSTKMMEKGELVNRVQLAEDRNRYVDLMTQLDPNFQPEPAPPAESPQ